MSSSKEKTELITHKNNAVREIDGFITDLIESMDPREMDKSDKFCYWIEDYVRFLKQEKIFKPTSLKRYKRGEIIKVHLGFNIGSEEGGLHYAVVLDKQNSIHSPVVTIVPLTSVKPTTNIKNLPDDNIYLGNEIFTGLNAQAQLKSQHLSSEIERLTREASDLNPNSEKAEEKKRDLLTAQRDANLLRKMQKEIQKMKKGSIALINQVTTISKIRIYDPKTNHDILSHLKLSNQKLDMIDAALIARYTGRL